MEMLADSFKHLERKYFTKIVRPHSHFDNNPSFKEHLRDFIEVIIEKIHHEPVVRELGEPQSKLTFKVFRMLTKRYEQNKRSCLPSKGQAFIHVLHSLQELHALVDKSGSGSSSRSHISSMH